MNRAFLAGLLGALALEVLSAPAVAQPRTIPPSLHQIGAVPPPAVEVAPTDERDARDTRTRLGEILRNYPPSLAQVLRLDPSLMARADYLVPYPALAAFIAQHPEIGRDPAFYLGQPYGNSRDEEDARAGAIRAFGDVMQSVVVLCGFAAFFALVGWLAYLIADHRRWLRATKTQTEAHSKLLDRLTSSDELLAYIQSPAGRHFLESAPAPLNAARPIGAPIGRILWSVQAGIVLAVIGVGLWFVKNSVIADLSGPLRLVAVLAISLGLGFALSAGVAFVLSQRLGLLEPTRP